MNQWWKNKNVWGFGLSSFLSDFSHEMATAILPTFVQELAGTHYAPQFMGLISGIANSIASLIRLGAGRLSDQLEHRKTLTLIGNSLVGIFIPLLGTAHTLFLVSFYQTVAWIGRAILGPARDTLLAASVTFHDYGKAFGLHRSLDTLGAIMGPLTASFFIAYYAPSTIFFIAAIPAFFSFLSLLFFTYDIPSRHKERRSFSLSFKDLPSAFLYFAGVILLFGLGNFNKTLLLLRTQECISSPTGLTASTIIVLYALLNSIRALSESFIGALADRTNKQYLLAFLGFGLFGVLSLGLVVPIPSLWFLLPLFIVAGISTATTTVVIKVQTALLLPTHMQGIGFGIIQATEGIAVLFSNLIIGFLWSQFSAELAFSYAALTSFSATLLLLFTKIEQK